MRSNPFVKFIKFIVKAAIFIAAVNYVFQYFESKIHKKKIDGGHFYSWKYGNIFFHKRGHGNPVLLIHGLNPANSGGDLMKLSKALSTKHTVYTIDLLGFGLSDKPWITYTNYIYVLLIQDFIKDVIKDYTDVIACDSSCLTLLQANKVDNSMLGKVVLLNPVYEDEFRICPPCRKYLAKVVDLPVIGTFLYNIYSLTGHAPFSREGRHVFTSKLTGHLATIISNKDDLKAENVIVYDRKENSGFTFGEINNALL